MKTRVEVAEYVSSGECQDDAEKTDKTCHHFGLCELRCLMDFIYESEPTDNEVLTGIGDNYS